MHLPRSTMVFLIAAAEARWHRNRVDYIRKKIATKRRYKQLLKLLGGHCQICKTKEDLTVDHIEGRTWLPRKYSHYYRVCRYWREYKAGVPLRCLCRSCNSRHVPGIMAAA